MQHEIKIEKESSKVSDRYHHFKIKKVSEKIDKKAIQMITSEIFSENSI